MVLTLRYHIPSTIYTIYYIIYTHVYTIYHLLHTIYNIYHIPSIAYYVVYIDVDLSEISGPQVREQTAEAEIGRGLGSDAATQTGTASLPPVAALSGIPKTVQEWLQISVGCLMKAW